jgi:hypothetical protein
MDPWSRVVVANDGTIRPADAGDVEAPIRYCLWWAWFSTHPKATLTAN